MNSKILHIKWIINSIKAITLLLILLVQIDIILRVMLAFGYIMLFNQKRWHKHLLIMLLMISILFIFSGSFQVVLDFINSKIS